MRQLSKLKLPAKLSNLRKFIDLVSKCAEDQGMNSEKVTDIGVATEEALVNICNYAYQGKIGEVKVTCMVDDENRFIIEIEDRGIPFDAKLLEDPNLTPDIDQRQVGGLGVFIIKELMDDVQYRREEDKNILILVA
ncbi:MAG: ATP-binding protein [Deltaproteobacteria bacterium]|nr:ATP-binding protein [Deltaproteobacteria bacterium]